MRKSGLPLKFELMPDSNNEKTFALFANPANRKLIAGLENAGAKVWLFPPLETEKVILEKSSVERLKNLTDFDWLILPDVLAADYFLENLEENAIDLFELDAVRVCALGEVVADRLRFAAVHADVITSSNETENVFSELTDYIGEREFGGLKFLFLKEVSADNNLTERLKAKGVAVIELPVYQASISNKLEVTKLKTLLKGGAIDEFILASPTDFIALRYYFEGETIAGVFAGIKILATDGVMLQTTKEHDLGNVGLFHLNKSEC